MQDAVRCIRSNFACPIWFVESIDSRMSADPKRIIPFKPVPLRARHDGWTAEKQIAFIEALAETACVEEACRCVGMSDTSAYKLRMRLEGWAFAKAWDAALRHAACKLVPAVLGRTLNGVPRPIFYKGEQVGEWRHYDERLTMFLLSRLRPQWFGRSVDQMSMPEITDAEGINDDSSYPLTEALKEIEPWMDEFDDIDEADEGDNEG